MKKSNLDLIYKQIARLYEMYSKELLQYFLSYTHDKMRADDMLQDLFLKMLRLDFINEVTSKHLLFFAAANLIKDDIRKHVRMHNVQKSLMLNENLVDEGLIYDRMDKQILYKMIEVKTNSMPRKRAIAFRLWSDGCSFKEISIMLNISSRTAESHIYKATKDLKIFMNRAVV